MSLLSNEDSRNLFEFEKKNKDYFEKMVPPRPDSYFEFESFNTILEGLLKEQAENKSLFYLIKNEAGNIVGRMNLVDIDWHLKSGEAGYRIGEHSAGKGAACKALNLMVEEAKLLGIKEIKARTTLNNIASQRVLEKCHFHKLFVDANKFIHYKLNLKENFSKKSSI
ncbi:GNAT family N-acetyltransferase [Heyndrickxia sp. MSNUG]|uniref:GNAT family N-acetyltransferase n=1 Tax=Heyndrickxia sp. MSNUG TaxID=3136677 RepID=UPI003C2DEB70